MNAPQTISPLDQPRREIDAIDDQLIALLKERIGIVSRVGKLKRDGGENGLFVRSGREGAMLKRIFESFEGNDFNPQAAAAIWRLIISASIHHESPVSISVFQTQTQPALYWMAREYFGGFVPMAPVGNASQVIGDLADGRATIGVLPLPDDTSPWWPMIAYRQERELKIFAHVPAVISPTMPKSVPFGLAVGHVTPEPSGDDQSYFRFTLEDTISTSKLHGLFQDAGLNTTIVHVISQPQMRSLLVRMEGFYDRQHPAIEKVEQALKDIDIFWLGSHARAICV